jgi:hypothetical protein
LQSVGRGLTPSGIATGWSSIRMGEIADGDRRPDRAALIV